MKGFDDMDDKNSENNIDLAISKIIDDALDSGNFDMLSKKIGDTVDSALDDVTKTISKGFGSAVNIIAKGFDGAGKIADRFISALSLEPPKEMTIPVNKKAIKKIPTLHSPFLIGLSTCILSAIIGEIFDIQLLSNMTAFFITAGIIGEAIICIMRVRKKIRLQYRRCFDEAIKTGYLEISAASKSLNIPVPKLIKKLTKMIEYNVFPQGHISEDMTYFLGSDELYDTYTNAINNRNQEQINRQNESDDDKNIRETLETGDKFIEEIRDSRNQLTDSEMIQKLETTELIVSKIFDRIEEKPELMAQARKFIHYYLPLTLKLVNSYEDFNTQGIETENIKKSKQEISKTIDTINKAFYKLYSGFFDNDIIDINSDISVLHTMLSQEGLIEHRPNN